MNLVVVGHVDHGKSTIIGRLLADTGSLAKGKLEQVREQCARAAKPFEYAFLLDALRAERAQGITMATARVFFKTARRSYAINDAPGHAEFLKSMVTGAARAEAALLVVDAVEGLRESTRRHAALLPLLGVDQVVVLVNKMDLVNYSRERFEALSGELARLLEGVGRGATRLRAAHVIPVSGAAGDNLASASAAMPWYSGPTLLAALDCFVDPAPLVDQPFRMPVQDVYRFPAGGDTRRIIAGTVASGRARAGDAVVFHPSGTLSRIRRVEAFPSREDAVLEAGLAGGFTLEDPVFVQRGEVASVVPASGAGCASGVPAPSPPVVARRVHASLFWLGRQPLAPGRDYVLKLGTARARARLESVARVIDVASLGSRAGATVVERNEVADCVLALASPMALEPAGSGSPRVPVLSRFVLVDGYDIAGGGLVRESLPAAGLPEAGLPEAGLPEAGLPEAGLPEAGVPGAGLPFTGASSPKRPRPRHERLGQRAMLVLLTDSSANDDTARALEDTLFARGRLVSTLSEHDPDRLAEKAALLMHAGMVVLAAVPGLSPAALAHLHVKLPAGSVRILVDADDLEAAAETVEEWVRLGG